MRIYQSATIIDEYISGFQSPASEFAEKPLSLDEKFGIGNPGIIFLDVSTSFPHLGIMKGDKVLIDLGRRPRPKSLIAAYIGDEVKIFQGLNRTDMDDVIFGVIVVVIRNVNKQKELV